MIRKYRMPIQNKGYTETVKIPQYDTNYMLVFEMTNLPEGTTSLESLTAKLEGLRADGLKYEYTGVITGATVSFEIDTRMTAAPGNGEARIVFSYATTEEVYASANFLTFIEASPVPDDAIDADTEEARSIAEEIQEIVDTAAGTVTQSIAPEYDPTLTYTVGAMVLYENELYRCTSAIATPEAWTQGHWTRTTVAQEETQIKEDLRAMPSVKESNETESDLDISDSQGNVILRLANGHIQTKYFNSDTTGNVITVAPSGADYTTIRGAVEAAASAGASETNPYTIQIASGSYDILSEFTSAEIAENDFIGLVVTNGITLKGMGITRDEVLLRADMDTSYESAKRNNVATINLHGNVGLENLTVKATHMRYAVHDDTGYGNGATPTTRIIRNCRFIALNTTSGGYGRISYGAGTDGSKTFVFEDCDFTDLVHIHTSTHAYSNVVWMFNCRGYGFTAADYASGSDNHYHIYGGDFKWINVVKGSNWTSQHLFIDGDIKDAFIGGWSGMQYELGDCSKHQPTALTSFPVGVAMAQSGNYRDKKATGADDCIGVCVYYDSTNNYALVQYRGWLCAEVLGFANVTIGQYLVVGSNGALSLSDSDAESIGKVVCSNPAGQHFIKLSI